MKNNENIITEEKNKFNFSLVKKFSISFLVIFSLFFMIIGLYIARTVKEQIFENIRSPMIHVINNEVNHFEAFINNVENIGKESVTFIKTLLKSDISKKEMNVFSKRYSLINGAIRTNLEGLKNDDISAVFLSNRTQITEEIKKMILQIEKGFREYAKGVLTFVYNMYFISTKNMIRVYKKDWAFEIEPGRIFNFDLFNNDVNQKNTGKWVQPYYDSILKRWMSSYISPVYKDNKLIGTVGHDIILDKLYEKLLKSEIYKTGFFFIFNAEKNIILSPKYLSHFKRHAEMGTQLNISVSDDPELYKVMVLAIKNSEEKMPTMFSYLEKSGKKNVFLSKKLNFLNWYIASIIPEDEILELFPELRLRFILSSLVFLFILFIIIILIIFYFIISPIKKITAVSREIHQGDLGARSNIRTGDEIGELSLSFDKMALKTEESFDKLEKDLLLIKNTEKALHESNEKFIKVFENSPYLIVLSRKSDSKFVNVNLNLETVTGYVREETIGASVNELDWWVNPTQREDMINIIDEEGFVKDFNFLLRRKDKKIRHCMVSAEQIKLNNDLYLVSIIRDVTEQELSKKEKEVLEEKLEQSKKMEALGTLAGGVAHDLNNILSGLVSYPDLLLTRIPKDSPMKRPLTTIKESGKKAAAIVQDLLALARRGVSTTTVVNLNALINEYLSSLEFKKLQSFHPDVIVRENLKDNLFNIIGSKVHLMKSLMNLVSNAAESMKNGGEIMISTKNKYFERDIKKYEIIKEGNYSVLEVKDCGVGISSTDIERIFEPFYTKKKMGKSGTGLGMAVVWGTIKDHKGFIDINSIEDKGTTFSLYFPVTNRELTRVNSEFNVNEFLGNGEKILVVDDILEQRELAYDILTRIGYSAAFVESGEKAIEYLKQNKVDLLLLDMIMDPGLDGLDTYKKILSENPKQKAIIVSGFSETERVTEAIKLGVAKYIRKPYSVETLSKSVKTILFQ